MEVEERLDSSELRIERLAEHHILDLFDCSDKDLNDFLKSDAVDYQRQWLGTTYLCIYEDRPIGYYTLLNDAIELSEKEKELFKKLNKGLRSYPAVKIGRIAVDSRFQTRGVGRYLLGHIFMRILAYNDLSGCRYITVDSYPDTCQFYLKHYFVDNQKYAKRKRATISMRFDLYDWHYKPELKRQITQVR